MAVELRASSPGRRPLRIRCSFIHEAMPSLFRFVWFGFGFVLIWFGLPSVASFRVSCRSVTSFKSDALSASDEPAGTPDRDEFSDSYVGG
jgi:hypothetical protein